MPTPTHCVVCHVVLTQDSPSGLCPTCLRSATPRERSAVPLTEDAAGTRTFADRRDPAADTRTGPRPVDPSLAHHRVPAGFVPLALLGHGGMGLVYQVWEPAADRVVALKLIRAATGPDLRARFEVEVKALAGLEHPNIVRVLAVDLHAPDPYFTMEFVDGQGLDRRLKERGPLPSAEAARVIETVARAVHAAHAAGVVHRDVKPSNVLVGSDGVPKVTDFGVAKRDGVDDLTVTGAVIGTPAFMSPEQASGRKVTRAADVYGLGATLYALLTGHAPFQGVEQADILAKVRTEDPPLPRSLRPDVPPALEGIVLKCLAKDPAARYATAADLADDLAKWQAGQTPTAPPPGWRDGARRWARRYRRAVALAGLLVLVASAAAVGTWAAAQPGRSPDRSPDPKAAALERIEARLRDRKEVTLIGPKGGPEWSEWRLGTGIPIDPTPTAPEFAFAAAGDTLLELVRDPQVDHYVVAVEVQQRSVNRGALDPGDKVGLYAGYDERVGPGGTVTHTCLRTEFSEYAPDPEFDPGFVRKVFVRGTAFNRTGAGSNDPDEQFAAATFETAGAAAGAWRRLTIEVSRDQVVALWQGSPEAEPTAIVTLPRDSLNTRWQRLRARSASVGGVVPDWEPRRPFGLYCRGAAVAVRKCVITPLP